MSILPVIGIIVALYVLAAKKQKDPFTKGYLFEKIPAD